MGLSDSGQLPKSSTHAGGRHAMVGKGDQLSREQSCIAAVSGQEPSESALIVHTNIDCKIKAL